jgi:hypothetical protein
MDALFNQINGGEGHDIQMIQNIINDLWQSSQGQQVIIVNSLLINEQPDIYSFLNKDPLFHGVSNINLPIGFDTLSYDAESISIEQFYSLFHKIYNWYIELTVIEDSYYSY